MCIWIFRTYMFFHVCQCVAPSNSILKTCVHVCARAHTHKHTHKHAHTHTHTHIHTHTHTHTHTYTHTRTSHTQQQLQLVNSSKLINSLKMKHYADDEAKVSSMYMCVWVCQCAYVRLGECVCKNMNCIYGYIL